MVSIVHDFFKDQPVKDAAVYFLRYIIHDWPDSEVKTILSRLRAAAGSSSKLIIFDQLSTHTCGSQDSLSGSDEHSTAPYPLLHNLGISGAGFLTALDLMVHTAHLFILLALTFCAPHNRC